MKRVLLAGILSINTVCAFSQGSGYEPVAHNSAPPRSVQAPDEAARRSMERGSALLDRFSSECERRTKKAERRFARYERKIRQAAKAGNDTAKHAGFESKRVEAVAGETGRLGNEPLLDSLRLVSGFAQHSGLSSETGKARQSIERAQAQLDIGQRTKAELQRRIDCWKSQAKEHPEYKKWAGMMEKERYYYSAQIGEYRKALRDPSVLDDKLMNALRRDPRFSDFLAALPAKPQDTEKMQPRQLVQQMMQSQAAAIDPDAKKLIADARRKGSDLLDGLSDKASGFGNIDNAAQVPAFTPNPYKTKSFWERIDVGFDLQFDRKTRLLPSSGVAGVQASFNFSQRWSAGLLVNYRFGTGEIRRIRFSHQGAGYGAFANYRVWKGLGVQAGFERNWRMETEVNENRYPSGWMSSALAGLTWEYGVGKKVKGTAGVFFDFLHRRHTPETNAILWRMGWKI
jgi:hypothetical protein